MGLSFSASAPGRCGIIGNPSDIYGGKVLSCSIPVRARVRLTLGESGPLPDDPTLWLATVSKLPLPDDMPFRLEWETDVPRSSGLSGSTALLAATIACVLAARGEPPDLEAENGRGTMAELLRDIEINAAKVAGGFQDAYMIVNGGLQLMDFTGKHPVVPGPHAKLTQIRCELPFLLVTTGIERLSGSVHGPMIQRWLDGDRAVIDAMETIRSLAPVGARALERGDLPTLGKAMDENHRLVSALGGSGEPIDALIALCKQEGAVSAKLAGAGLGGTVIALTDEPDELRERLSRRGYTRLLRPSIEPGLRMDG